MSIIRFIIAVPCILIAGFLCTIAEFISGHKIIMEIH
jgi:hypothetical protein